MKRAARVVLLTLLSLLLAACALTSEIGPDAGAPPLGRLSYGVDPSTNEPWTAEALAARLGRGDQDQVAQRTAGVVKRAEQTLNAELLVVPALHLEGVLFTEPRYKESQEAVRQLPDVYAWATCARVADAPLADRCAAKAADAIRLWATTYQPSGDPIDENNLVPLLQAIDLIRPRLAPADAALARDWVVRLLKQNDAYYAAVRPTSSSKTNNHATWGFANRAIEATVLGDDAAVRQTRELLHAQAARNVRPDGSTEDFYERDALHYQVYDLEAYLDALLFARATVDADTEAALLRGIDFLEPFVTGQEQHVEFVHSRVPFDRQRAEAGGATYQNAPWQLKDGRTLLYLARARFPEIRAWTQAVVDEGYDARTKQLAALEGAG